jgi:glycogen operon protein
MRFLHGKLRGSDNLPDVKWTDFQGQPLEWRDAGLSNLCLTVRPSAEVHAWEGDEDTVFIIFNRSGRPAKVRLPDAPQGGQWVLVVDTANPAASPKRERDTQVVKVKGASVVAYSLDIEGASS